jgi:DNA-binding IclR family transcriptional regulator
MPRDRGDRVEDEDAEETAESGQSSDSGGSADPGESARGRAGSQTLLRGLDVIDVVAEGPISLGDLAVRLGLTRSTTHRLASALVDRRYLRFVPRTGYTLGPRLLQLGFMVREESDLPRVAAPHLERLALLTEDTVHLGVLDGERVQYLDKVSGKRRINISSRIGELQPIPSTGLGKALILDFAEEDWVRLYRAEKDHRSLPALQEWLTRMRDYSRKGYAFDLEENEDQIRCVAAPIRDVSGAIVGAISVASAAQYMSDERMHALTKEVVATAQGISQDLGWSDRADSPGASRSLAPKGGRSRA